MSKKFLLITILLLSLALMAGCSISSPAGAAQTGDESGSPVGESAAQPVAPDGTPVPGAGEIPQAMQLALGTFKLEDTQYPMDAGQAAALLPLWKAARSLSQSETVAAEELQAVVDQIQETMSAEQMEAISEMSLSFEDMGAIAEQLGLEFGAGQFGDIDPEMRATMQAARESGQAPPEGFGPDGGLGPGGGLGMREGGGPGGGAFAEGMSPEQMQTAVAERGGLQRAGLGVPVPLLDAVIQFLGSKAQ